jgi:hypothetical protein
MAAAWQPEMGFLVVTGVADDSSLRQAKDV